MERMIILFVPLPHRNRCYGNGRYDKTCRYATVERYLLLCPFIFIVDWLGGVTLLVTRSSKAKAFYTATRAHLHRQNTIYTAT